jgi:hypothetical protein
VHDDVGLKWRIAVRDCNGALRYGTAIVHFGMILKCCIKVWDLNGKLYV